MQAASAARLPERKVYLACQIKRDPILGKSVLQKETEISS